MIVDETAVWKTVADSVWGGGARDACIAGGFGVGKGRKTKSDDAATKDRLGSASYMEQGQKPIMKVS